MDNVQPRNGRLGDLLRYGPTMKHFVPGTILLLAAATALDAAAASNLKPMSATYAVLRDGKAVGDATYTLHANADGSWTLLSVTKGSAGMARLVGLDVREESTFRWLDGKPEGLHYDYHQDAAIKHKERRIDFDWSEKQAHVRDNGKNFAYAIPAGTIDRSTVAIALGMALAGGASSATLPVAAKERVEQQRYETRGAEQLQVPAGSFQAIRVERTDASGKARSWYAPTVMAMPLRVEQTQGDGSTVVMELKQR